MNCNEKIVVLLQRLKPEIKDVIEQLNLVSSSTSISASGIVLLVPASYLMAEQVAQAGAQQGPGISPSTCGQTREDWESGNWGMYVYRGNEGTW